MIWVSGAMPTRDVATVYEAEMKNRRDDLSEKFKKVTGHDPVPLRQVFRENGVIPIPGGIRSFPPVRSRESEPSGFVEMLILLLGMMVVTVLVGVLFKPLLNLLFG